MEREREALWREWEACTTAYHKSIAWYLQLLGIVLSAILVLGSAGFLERPMGSVGESGLAWVLWAAGLAIVGGHPFLYHYAVGLGNRIRGIENDLDTAETTDPILEAMVLGSGGFWLLLGLILQIIAWNDLSEWFSLPETLLVATWVVLPLTLFLVARRAWPLVARYRALGVDHLDRS